jgi:putative alpha-1,2-mannosidase
MGISYVSIENARVNRETETGEGDLENILADAMRQ